MVFRLDIDDTWRIENRDGLNWMLIERVPREKLGKLGETHRDVTHGYFNSLAFALVRCRDRMVAATGDHFPTSLVDALERTTKRIEQAAANVMAKGATNDRG